MKTLNDVLEGFFGNVNANPPKLRDVLRTLLINDDPSDKEYYENLPDSSLVSDWCSWSLDDDFSRNTIKGMSPENFLFYNMDTPVIIKKRVANSRRSTRGKLYEYEITIDGETFKIHRYSNLF